MNYSSNMIEHLVKMINCSENSFGNPFCYFLDEKLILCVSDGYVNSCEFQNPAATTSLLSSLMLYLWLEAPADEQNFFMIGELLSAHQMPDDLWFAQTDLDRLFKLLEDKNENHSAMHKYRDFKKKSGEKQYDVACELRRSFFQYPSATKLNDFYGYLESADAFENIDKLKKIAKAFTCMIDDAFLIETDHLEGYKTWRADKEDGIAYRAYDENTTIKYKKSEHIFLAFVFYAYALHGTPKRNNRIVTFSDFVWLLQFHRNKLESDIMKDSSLNPRIKEFYDLYIRSSPIVGEANFYDLVMHFYNEFASEKSSGLL